MSRQWSPSGWMYRKSRPEDSGYFENMTRIIFQGGLNWRMIDKKWPNFKEAFNDFSIDSVANFEEADVERLMNNKGIVRNRAKIVATISNAKEFQAIIREYGSFQTFLRSLDKSDNYSHAVEELSKKFSRLGPSSAGIFLYSVGENIKHEM
ncbi:MAG: DNA-3-methyladenine glycosylase I [Candidatus Bathyarchaeota archaeon]|nr:MAG: DNA-3-methyladenine glycosylase I [Candidatus Bathyarchaeota archaeon]